MKRIIMLIALALTVSASSSFAGELKTGGTVKNGLGNTIYGGVDSTAAAAANASVLGRLSKGVELGVAYDKTAYSLTTKHLTGSKSYGTSYNSTSIFSKDVASGTGVTAPTKSDATEFSSGWTAM